MCIATLNWNELNLKSVLAIVLFAIPTSAQSLSTEQLFSRYLVSGDPKIAAIIATDQSSAYSLFCKARLEEDTLQKKFLLSQFIASNPKLGIADARIERGYLYCAFDLLDSALADLNIAASLAPDNPYVYYFRGTAMRRMDSTKSAIQDFTMAIGLDDKFDLAYHMRGNALLVDSNYVEAIRDYSTVIRLRKDYDLAYLMRGIAYLRSSDFKKATKDFERAMQLNPKHEKKAKELIQKAKNKERF